MDLLLADKSGNIVNHFLFDDFCRPIPVLTHYLGQPLRRHIVRHPHFDLPPVHRDRG